MMDGYSAYDEYELDEEADEAHHHETKRGSGANLVELCTAQRSANRLRTHTDTK